MLQRPELFFASGKVGLIGTKVIPLFATANIKATDIMLLYIGIPICSPYTTSFSNKN